MCDYVGVCKSECVSAYVSVYECVRGAHVYECECVSAYCETMRVCAHGCVYTCVHVCERVCMDACVYMCCKRKRRRYSESVAAIDKNTAKGR